MRILSGHTVPDHQIRPPHAGGKSLLVLDPNLVKVALDTAVKAVTSLAVRSSAPAWRRAVQRFRPAPAILRQSPSWPELTLAAKECDALSKYLSGRLCQGLLEMLAFVEMAGQSEQHEKEKRLLAESFTKELAGRIGLPASQVDRIAATLWTHMADGVRLLVGQLRDARAFAEEDILFVTQLLQQADKSDKNNTPLVNTIIDRAELAASYRRVARANSVVGVISSAVRKRYSKQIMPHSRDDHRVPIEDIYVARMLRPTAAAVTIGMRQGVIEVVDEDVESLSAPDVDGGIREEELADRRFVVVGNPGAGKSTFTRHLLYQLGGANDSGTSTAPIALELKDHPNPADSYVTVLTERLRVITQAELDVEVVRDILDLGMATVVFDGLDEIGNIDERRSTVASIQAFCHRYPLVRVVVTSRQEGYVGARLDPRLFPVYHLPDFSTPQVELYVRRWFHLVADVHKQNPATRGTNFLHESEHVDDLRNNPLMLSLLCLLYDYEGYIPRNRPAVYEHCAELLFERWDRLRRVPSVFRTTAQTRYLVQELAYHFFRRTDRGDGESEHRLHELVKDFFERNVAHETAAAFTQAQDFLDYCSGRAWLLTKVSGSDRGERRFDFTHRTFMEYFAACYLVRQCGTADRLVDEIKPMIRDGASDVVAQIAIQQIDVRLAGGIDACLRLLVFESAETDSAEGRTYLAFALRSLRFIRPSPRMLVVLCSEAIRAFGATLESQWWNLLIDLPADMSDSLDRSWQTALNSAEADPALRLGSGLVFLLTATQHPMPSLRGFDDLQNLIATAEPPLHRLADGAPDVVAEMHRRGLLPEHALTSQ